MASLACAVPADPSPVREALTDGNFTVAPGIPTFDGLEPDGTFHLLSVRGPLTKQFPRT
jgi:hypothetical protein